MRLFFAISVLMLCAVSCSAPAEDPLADEIDAIHARLAASEGGELVRRAIDAAGGIRAWLEAPTSSYIWDASFGNFVLKSHLVADNRSRRIYHDILETSSHMSPLPLEAQMAWDGTNAWIYPDTLMLNPRFWASTAYYFQSIPFVLADPGLRYERLPDDTLDGHVQHMVKVSYNDHVGDAYGDTYVLYVEPESGRMNAIRYTSTFGQGRPAPGEVSEGLLYYLDYQSFDELTVPTRFERYTYSNSEKGDLVASVTVSDISFRAPFDEARLVMPEGGRVQPFE